MRNGWMRLFLAAAFYGLLGASVTLTAAEPGLTRTHSGGDVTVRVTYLEAESKDDARFRVVLDTHSVNLDAFDLKTLSRLRDESGKTYEPTGIENKGSGHHREVIVVFPSPSAEGKRLDLIIKDVARVDERIFSWDFQ